MVNQSQSQRRFLPWVGKRYSTEGLNGTRVMILGESHYGEFGMETSDFTANVVREWGQWKRHRFFTSAQKLVANIAAGQWISNEERASFWDRVVFYNFVQKFVGNRPRIRPTEEMWTDALEPFATTLAELEPHLVVVLGFELKRHVQTAIAPNTRVAYVQHPSSRGFRLANWQLAVQLALDGQEIAQ